MSNNAQHFVSTLSGRNPAEIGVALAELAEYCEKGEMDVPDGIYPLSLLRVAERYMGVNFVDEEITDLTQFVVWAEERGFATIVSNMAMPGAIIVFADDKNAQILTGAVVTKLNGVWYDAAEMDSGKVSIHRRAWSCYGPVGVARRVSGNYARWTKCIIPINRFVS